MGKTNVSAILWWWFVVDCVRGSGTSVCVAERGNFLLSVIGQAYASPKTFNRKPMASASLLLVL